MVDYSQLDIPVETAGKMVADNYGIHGRALRLPGEIDFNFRIEVDDGDGYVLKVSRPGEDADYLDFQQKLLIYIEKFGEGFVHPKVILNKSGSPVSTFVDQQGQERKVRLLSYVPGRIWGHINPKTDALRKSLGHLCGKLAKGLQKFDHERAHRTFDWDIAQYRWTLGHQDLFPEDKKKIIAYFQHIFQTHGPSYDLLRKGVVHNDANDNNIIVSEDLAAPQVITVIDYGDACHTQHINDVAVTCAYGIMGYNDPLDAALPIVAGYHEYFPLLEDELYHLYGCIAMRLVISVTKSAINRQKEPDNRYLQISDDAAWELLGKWYALHPDFALCAFRQACGFTAHPQADSFDRWTQKNTFELSDLFPTIGRNSVHHLDLSVSSPWIGHQAEFNDLDLFQFKIEKLQLQHPHDILAGGYLEPRPIYTSTEYDKLGNSGRESRTIHLGTDFWLPALTPVHALFDGEVAIAVNDRGDKEYGGLIVLKHQVEGFSFFTLYGHLTVASATSKRVGQSIAKGDLLGHLGNYPENGNWAPHLHFQVMLSLLGHTKDFPGVAYFKQLRIWKGICPDPNLLFKSRALTAQSHIDNDQLVRYRKKHLGKGLSLQYNVPLKMVRGAGPYLLDQFGQKYLDTVNNVAHVGHENYRVVKAGQDQMALLNTNSRYLHENINQLAQELLKTLPAELCVVHFVNSGSEANELALRMVKTVTGQKDIIASEMGYHGNSNACIDISSYKFDGKGGTGAPEHTHIFPLPDTYRGKYQGKDAAGNYASEVQRFIEGIQAKGRQTGGFIVEPIISCGGQIELPEGFLKKAYNYVRSASGLCISDEVQVGCGRMGKTFWGFQLHGVVPDIITIGKPLGNGHPLAAVVCTRDVADRFANGMEYFNTFGGNPVSCAIGTEVLKTVAREKLQENALEVGEYIKTRLKALARLFPIIGDVRGQGLFLGIELVNGKKDPLPEQTNYLVNRMKDHGILMSIDGPYHNVLKIKPPMIFNRDNAEELVFYLERILAEDFLAQTVQ